MKTFAAVAGRRVSLSNLGKDLYPAYGFTKAQVLAYYRGVAPVMLPHLKDRALTLKRYPEGVAEAFFFEKRCPAHRPSWVSTAVIPRKEGERPMTVCLVNDLPALIWVANLASIELHVPLARSDAPGSPDAAVFDLDPGEGAGILGCARVALIIRDMLTPLGLTCFVKTSGQKGLHVYVPVIRRETTFEMTKRFTKSVAEVLQRNFPDLVTAKMGREERRGRIFINWSQNDASKTMVCAYSLRAREKPFVSTPLSWHELEGLRGRVDAEALQFLPIEALRRTEQQGDLFGAILSLGQTLPRG